MVGKVWSDLEERYFWRTAVSHSSKRAGADKAKAEKTWDQLASEMHRAMERLGHVRRKYTSTMLFEHYFQNIEGERRSPNAAAYVNEYLAKLGPGREVVNPRAARPRREARKRRARKASPAPAPADDVAGQHEDKNDHVATKPPTLLPTLREMDLPDPRPFPPPRPSLSERRNFRPSQPLRPRASAPDTHMLPSPLDSASSYDGLSHASHQGMPYGWNMASPPLTSPYGAPTYQPRTPLTPGFGNKQHEEVVWGYQMGKRSVQKPSQSDSLNYQTTSAAGYATHYQHPDGSEMGVLVPEPTSAQSATFLQPTPLDREPSTSSFVSGQGPQREFTTGYQFQDYSRSESMPSAYSSVTSQCSELAQTVSDQSVESTLFVEDENNVSHVAYRPDQYAEESGDDIREAEVKNDTHDLGARAITYRDLHKKRFAEWSGQGADYGSESGAEYYPDPGQYA